MVFYTRKAAAIAGILVLAIGWAIKAPMLADWAITGLITGISFLLLFAAVVSILVGALMVQLDKPARLLFALHILFASMAFVSLHFFFAMPFALGVLVAVTLVFWPVPAGDPAIIHRHNSANNCDTQNPDLTPSLKRKTTGDS